MIASGQYSNPDLIARITRLAIRSRRAAFGAIAGRHKSPLQGLSPEFTEYRDYLPGDDLKSLDWRAFARADRFYVKRFEDESNLRATLVVDASGSMRYGPPDNAKFDHAARLAVALAALFLKQRDAVGLTLCRENDSVALRANARPSQLAKIIETLESASPEGETDLGAALAAVADQIRGHGMIIALSDCLTNMDSFHNALGKLRHAGHDIVVLHIVDDDEMTLPFTDTVVFRDLEGDAEILAEPWAFQKDYQAAMRTFVDSVKDGCQRRGVDHRLLRTRNDPGDALARYLHERLTAR